MSKSANTVNSSCSLGSIGIPPDDEAIRIRNLNVVLGGSHILRDVNLSIPANRITALIGPNGSGKSTLLKSILGLIKYSGSIELYPSSDKNPKFGYIPQHMDIEKENPVRVIDFLLLTSQKRPLWLGTSRQKVAEAMEAMKTLGVDSLKNRFIGKLSGGEFQRVMLAKLQIEKPDIVLMDEPVSGIDIAGEELFCGILEDLQKSHGFTLLLVSHDLSVVSHHASNVVCINREIKCSGHPLEVMTTENLKELYGQRAKLIHHDDHHKHGKHRERI